MPEKIYHVVDGKMVLKPGNRREPGRRYRAIASDPSDNEQIVCELTPDEEAARDKEEAQWETERPIREARAQEQRRKAEEFRNSLKYELRLVAFLDVWGWRHAIERSQNDPELVKVLGLGLSALRGQVDLISWEQDHGDEAGWPGDPQATQFSDCIVLSTRPDFAGETHLISSIGLVCTIFLRNGFLVRGGVTIGEMYHRDGLAYGPALTHAYDLESKEAKYPRVILDKGIAKIWGQGAKYFHKDGTPLGYGKTWRKLPNDDWVFLDFLQPMNAKTFETPNAESVRRTLNPARVTLQRGLSEHQHNRSVLEKYRWFAEYYNSLVAEYPHARVELIPL